MDFIRKLGWRLVVLILLSGWVVNFTSTSNISESTQTSLAVSVVAGFGFGFLFRRLRWIQHIDTWIHEFGHAAAATLFGAVPQSIRLNQDSSGVTNYKFKKMTGFREIVISAAGPMATVTALYLCVSMANKGLAFYMLPVIGFVVLVVLVSTVRSGFGWLVGILIWVTIGLAFVVSELPIIGYYNAAAKEIYLGALLGIGSGVALRASFTRLRMHGGDGDEGKIAARLHVPEGLVDFSIFLLHIAVIWLAMSQLSVSTRLPDYVAQTPELQTKVQEVIDWIRTLIPAK